VFFIFLEKIYFAFIILLIHRYCVCLLETDIVEISITINVILFADMSLFIFVIYLHKKYVLSKLNGIKDNSIAKIKNEKKKTIS
jgi:hypothetical protein